MIYYDEAERGKILADYRKIHEELRGWEEKYLEEDEPNPETLNQYSEITRKINEVAGRYLRMTPVIPLSRCPYSGEVTYYSIDHIGIDGPWWDYTRPLRAVSGTPVRFHTMTGSLKLEGDPEESAQQVRPGPERPYVIPQLLDQPGVKAVISTVKIGGHTGYPVVYYKEDVNAQVEPARIWGMYLWQTVDRFGKLVHLEPDESDFSQDFDLTDWVDRGKLLWVKPGDTEFTLRTGVNGCPYLNVEGDTRFQIIIDGEVTHIEEEA